MLYYILTFFLFSIFITHPSYSGDFSFERKKGYFGYTRHCLEDMNRGNDYGGCISGFLPSLVIDTITSPIETIINNIEAEEGNNSLDKSSSSKKSSKPEIPEEKVIKNKLSLIFSAAADANQYLMDGTQTPLLASAASALRSLYPEENSNLSAPEDLTQEALGILQVQSHVLKAIQKMNGEIPQ